MAAHINDRSEYTHAHTKAWSAEIASHDAFIFVCPQYNWGYPAAVKNAIDFLFKEWMGKKGMVIAYGSRGGGKAAIQLRQVLQGLRMKVVGGDQTGTDLPYGKEETLVAAMAGGVDGLAALWGDKKEAIVSVFGELLEGA